MDGKFINLFYKGMIKLQNNKSLIDTFNKCRFPLIVFVILIHANLTNVTFQGIPVLDASSNRTLFLMYFLSEALTRLAVPVFFIISGYLFFYKLQQFNYKIYVGKLKRRLKSLLTPYLIWNILAYIFIITKTLFPQLFPNIDENNILSIKYFIKGLWTLDTGGCPHLYPMWYVRDLMVMVILSPIIYYSIKKAKLIFIIILFLIYISPLQIPIGLGGIFFFSLGAYLNICGLNIENDFKKKYLWIFILLYLIMAIFDTLYKDIYTNNLFHKCAIIFGIISVIGVSTYINMRNKLYAEASFFIFCINIFILGNISKLLLKFIGFQNEIKIWIIYFCSIIFTIIISMIVYIIMKRYTPKILNVLIGGRL